jgi:hypothetical protein
LQPLAYRHRVGKPAPRCLETVKEEYAALGGMVARISLPVAVFETDLPLGPDQGGREAPM